MDIAVVRGSVESHSLGQEFVPKVLDRWVYENAVTLDFSRAGKPTDNAFFGSISGRLRDVLLGDARAKIDACGRDYNESCPHMSLCWNEYAAAAAIMNAAERLPDSHLQGGGEPGGDPHNTACSHRRRMKVLGQVTEQRDAGARRQSESSG